VQDKTVQIPTSLKSLIKIGLKEIQKEIFRILKNNI